MCVCLCVLLVQNIRDAVHIILHVVRITITTLGVTVLIIVTFIRFISVSVMTMSIIVVIGYELVVTNKQAK